MSGFRGTIGSPERDKIAAWIYDHVDGMDPKRRQAVFKFVQKMVIDKNHLLNIEDKGFRERMAKLVKFHFFQQINLLFATDSPMATRMRNLAIRNYRQAIGAGINAPTCFWCGESIRMEQPFKKREDQKVHYSCATAFDKEQDKT